MTRFNPNGDLMPIEQWEELGEKKALETGASWRILGGLVLGGIGFAASLEILGIAVGGYLCYSAYEKIRKSGLKIRAVRDFGCVAHLLNESEFRSFKKQFGDREVHQQIEFAIAQGWDVSKFALNWFETQQGQLPAAVENKLPHFVQTQNELSISEMPTATPRFDIHTANTVVQEYSVNNSIDIVAQLTDRIGNAMIIGTPGSGKGMLIANCIRAAKAKHPDLKVFVIDPKADPDEIGYWDGAADILKSFPCERATPDDVVNFLQQSFDEYYEYWEKHRRVLLILDEGTLSGSKAKSAKSDVVKNFVVAIASAGDSQGRNIWLTSLSPFVGDLGINLNASSQLTTVAIVREAGVLKQWSKASTIEKADADTITTLIKESECNRAVYSGATGKWHSMPKLHNYSAKDRDNRKPNGDALSTQERSQLRDRTETATAVTPAVELMIDKLTRSRQNNLDSFIKFDLREKPDDRLRRAIAQGMKQHNRTDLLEKIGLGYIAIPDPVEAMKFLEPGTDEEILMAWFLHTGQHLNDQGIQILKEKLGKS